jgi:hypothetical protein
MDLLTGTPHRTETSTPAARIPPAGSAGNRNPRPETDGQPYPILFTFSMLQKNLGRFIEYVSSEIDISKVEASFYSSFPETKFTYSIFLLIIMIFHYTNRDS